jgi:hypothetical protein
MIFDNLRDRVTVTIDTKSRKASVCEVPSSQRSASSTERPKRRRKATPKKATTKRRYAVRPTPQTERRKVEAPKRAERRSVTKRVATPSPRTYSPTVGGLFYATGRDGATSGYPRLSGLAERQKGGAQSWYSKEELPWTGRRKELSAEAKRLGLFTKNHNAEGLHSFIQIVKKHPSKWTNSELRWIADIDNQGVYYLVDGKRLSNPEQVLKNGFDRAEPIKPLPYQISTLTVPAVSPMQSGPWNRRHGTVDQKIGPGYVYFFVGNVKFSRGSERGMKHDREYIAAGQKPLFYIDLEEEKTMFELNDLGAGIIGAKTLEDFGSSMKDSVASKGGHTYFYWIDMDERGEFSAHVDNPHGKTVFEIPDAEAMEDLIQDGFMRHTSDIDDLAEYLKDRGIMGKNDTLVESNWYMNEEDEEEDDEDGETLDDSLASTLADYTVDDVRAVQDLNNKLRELDSSFQHVAFRVYTTGSKKSKYVLRRYELDLTSAQPVNHNRKEALRWKRSLQHKEVFYRTFLGAQMKEVGLFKPTSMSPKIADKYLRKHFGISWNDLLEEKTSTLKAKIAEYVARFRRDNEAKMEAMSRKQAEREERISTTKAARETAKAEREERIAKRRIEAEQRKEARRKPTPTAAPVMPSAMPEEVAAPAPRKTRKPRLPKAAATATTKPAPMPSAMPAQAAAVPSDGDLDKVEKDMAELKALLQQMITQK